MQRDRSAAHSWFPGTASHPMRAAAPALALLGNVPESPADPARCLASAEEREWLERELRVVRTELSIAKAELSERRLREANATPGSELERAPGSLDAQRRRTERLAVVAHELRKPLSPIRAAASLLARRVPEDPVLAQLQCIIERQIEHMSRLVADLLDESRVATGKLAIEKRRIASTEFLDAAVDACRSAFDARRQRLRVRKPRAALEWHADPARLTQILTNLLDNASKFTPENGAIALTMRVRRDSVAFFVSDTGIGISADELAGVFEPFAQSARALRFRGDGLGIGLSVVRDLVQAHGGTVIARSAGNGRGTTFAVSLPRDAAPCPFEPGHETATRTGREPA